MLIELYVPKFVKLIELCQSSFGGSYVVLNYNVVPEHINRLVIPERQIPGIKMWLEGVCILDGQTYLLGQMERKRGKVENWWIDPKEIRILEPAT